MKQLENTGHVPGTLTRINTNDPVQMEGAYCECCLKPIYVGEVLFVHNETALDFCSASCAELEIASRIWESKYDR